MATKLGAHARAGSLRALGLLLTLLFGLMTGLASAASLSGLAYEDINGDGIRDVGEGPVPGVSLILTNQSNLESMTVVTDETGRYSFSGLGDGDYLLTPPMARNLLVRAPEIQPGNPIRLNLNGNLTGFNLGVERKCAEIKTKKVLWDIERPGCAIITLEWTNIANFSVSHIFFYNQPPVTIQSINPFSASPSYIPVNPPMMPGETRTFTIEVCGVQPDSEICLDMSAHNSNLEICCPVKYCVKLPPCDCAQVLDQSITQNPDGSYTVCFTFQSLVDPAVAPFVNWVTIVPPPGVTLSQTVFAVNPPVGIPYGGTWQICFTATGLIPGSNQCFLVGLRDRNFRECCSFQVYYDVPDNACVLEGLCVARKPFYGGAQGAFPNWVPFAPRTISVVTQEAAFFGNQPAVRIINLEDYQTVVPPLGVPYQSTPLDFVGPQTSDPTTHWTGSQLGSVFGITIDRRGHIFTTATSAYSNDVFVNGGAGTNDVVMIFKIENGTGQVKKFVLNTAGTGIPNATLGGGLYSGLGNITFDDTHDQLFVTNMEDGRIYRVTGLAGSAGTVQADVYDPFGADASGPGTFAPHGERLWGIQWHAGRLFFSRWVKDIGSPADKVDYLSNPLTQNEVWSVAINASGQIVPASIQKEVDMPYLPSQTYSNPVSDIQFNAQGKMMVAERSMWADTQPSAHQSRGIQFECLQNMWVMSGAPLDNLFGVGNLNAGRNACGGTDYDFSTASDVSNPNSGARVWYTSDWMAGPPTYGITGVPTAGGTFLQSIIMDLGAFKTQMGDVELPCPTPGLFFNVTLQDYVGAVDEVELFAQLLDINTGEVVAEQTLHANANGEAFFSEAVSVSPGQYRMVVKAGCWLRKANVVNLGSDSVAEFSLIAGDINDDNEVGPGDLSLLSAAFLSTPGDSRWLDSADIDGDGEIGASDLSIISANFLLIGD